MINSSLEIYFLLKLTKEMSKYLIALLCLVSSSSYAYTGNELLKELQVQNAMYEDGFSMGFVSGVFDTSVMSGVTCPPDGVTYSQIRDVVKSELAASPQNRHMQAAVLTLMTFQKTWPCRAKANKNK